MCELFLFGRRHDRVKTVVVVTGSPSVHHHVFVLRTD